MIHERIVSLTLLALLSVLLLGCEGLPGPLTFQQRDADARNRLESAFQHLPTVPGALLVQRVEAGTGGQLAECAGLQFQALYGTNDLSFANVLDFYSGNLQAQGWHLHLRRDFGVAFDMAGEYALAVSDSYNASFIKKDVVQDAKIKFGTIYLLELNTSLELPVPDQCKGA